MSPRSPFSIFCLSPSSTHKRQNKAVSYVLCILKKSFLYTPPTVARRASQGTCVLARDSAEKKNLMESDKSRKACLAEIRRVWHALFEYWILSSAHSKTFQWILDVSSQVYGHIYVGDVKAILELHTPDVIRRVRRARRRPTQSEPDLDSSLSDKIADRLEACLETLKTFV